MHNIEKKQEKAIVPQINKQKYRTMSNEIAKQIISCLLTQSKPKEEWTYCPVFRCVMNTGCSAGVDKNKCRIGKDCNNCGALKK